MRSRTRPRQSRGRGAASARGEAGTVDGAFRKGIGSRSAGATRAKVAGSRRCCEVGGHASSAGSPVRAEIARLEIAAMYRFGGRTCGPGHGARPAIAEDLRGYRSHASIRRSGCDSVPGQRSWPCIDGTSGPGPGTDQRSREITAMEITEITAMHRFRGLILTALVLTPPRVGARPVVCRLDQVSRSAGGQVWRIDTAEAPWARTRLRTAAGCRRVACRARRQVL